MGWGFGDLITHALAWASSHHLPQGKSYHPKCVTRHEKYVNCTMTRNSWNMIISLHEVRYDCFASIRSCIKEYWHQDCSMWNSTQNWPTKSKRTPPGFQQSFTRLQTVNGLGVTIFERWPVLLETEILGRLQVRRKIKFWGCSAAIFPLSWISKSWTTLPASHWLPIQPDPSNGLELTEFCTTMKLLKLSGTEPQ
jgi:hypothetical protein